MCDSLRCGATFHRCLTSCSECSKCRWRTHLTDHNYFDPRQCDQNTPNLSLMLGKKWHRGLEFLFYIPATNSPCHLQHHLQSSPKPPSLWSKCHPSPLMHTSTHHIICSTISSQPQNHHLFEANIISPLPPPLKHINSPCHLQHHLQSSPKPPSLWSKPHLYSSVSFSLQTIIIKQDQIVFTGSIIRHLPLCINSSWNVIAKPMNASPSEWFPWITSFKTKWSWHRTLTAAGDVKLCCYVMVMKHLMAFITWNLLLLKRAKLTNRKFQYTIWGI